MGATSVTGTGPGSADGMNKGSEHMTLGVSHLIGTRIVRSGKAVIGGGGNVTVEFPPLPGVVDDYIPIVSNLTAAAAVGKTAFTTTSLTMAGTATQTVGYIIVKLS